jgi:hypothetical protein
MLVDVVEDLRCTGTIRELCVPPYQRREAPHVVMQRIREQL